jgi:excisionase family DNA binding protein
MSNETDLRRPLSTSEAAEVLGVNERTLRQWTRRGYVRVTRIGAGGRLRYPQSEIARLCEGTIATGSSERIVD